MKTLKLMSVAVIFAIGFVACEKKEEAIIQTTSSVDMGKVHNEICINVLQSMPTNRSSMTIHQLDSVFLVLYPEFTQTQLDSIKDFMNQLIKKV